MIHPRSLVRVSTVSKVTPELHHLVGQHILLVSGSESSDLGGTEHEWQFGGMAYVVKPTELVVGSPGLVVGQDMVKLVVVDGHLGTASQGRLNQPPHRAIEEVVGDDVIELRACVNFEGGHGVELADITSIISEKDREEEVVLSTRDWEGLDFPNKHPGFIGDGTNHERHMVELSLGEEVNWLTRDIVSVDGGGPGVEDIDGGTRGGMVHQLVLGGGDFVRGQL